jgi:hypothetical protein
MPNTSDGEARDGASAGDGVLADADDGNNRRDD